MRTAVLVALGLAGIIAWACSLADALRYSAAEWKAAGLDRQRWIVILTVPLFINLALPSAVYYLAAARPQLRSARRHLHDAHPRTHWPASPTTVIDATRQGRLVDLVPHSADAHDDVHATLVIHRGTDAAGQLRRLNVLVDSTVQVRLKQRTHVDLRLSPGSHELLARLGGTEGRPLQVDLAPRHRFLVQAECLPLEASALSLDAMDEPVDWQGLVRVRAIPAPPRW